MKWELITMDIYQRKLVLNKNKKWILSATKNFDFTTMPENVSSYTYDKNETIVKWHFGLLPSEPQCSKYQKYNIKLM